VKRSILLFGLVGIVGCFLPMLLGMSWFEMRRFDEGWSVWLVMAAFALPTFVAAGADTNRLAAIVGTASFGYLAFKFGTGVFDLLLHTSIGGILMGVSVVGGLASSVLAFGASDRR
jgi:hypothetical protein